MQVLILLEDLKDILKFVYHYECRYKYHMISKVLFDSWQLAALEEKHQLQLWRQPKKSLRRQY